jgi:hypothetical protein
MLTNLLFFLSLLIVNQDSTWQDSQSIATCLNKLGIK